MIITLIGSARFEPWFKLWNKALSLAGHTVFGLSSYPSENGGNKDWYTPEDKDVLDWVHKEKIRLSEAVVLLNVFAYTGSSTESELDFAFAKGIKVYPLESWGEGIGVNGMHHSYYRDAVRAYDCLGHVSRRATNQRPFEGYGAVLDLLNGVGAAAGPDFALRRRLVELIEAESHRLLEKAAMRGRDQLQAAEYLKNTAP